MQLPPLAKVTEAPLEGAEKVTLAPDTSLPNWSVTVATSGLVKAVLTWADCPEPELSVMVAGGPAVMVGVAAPQALDPFLAVMVGVPSVLSP